MKPAEFEYHRARSLGDALALLAAHPGAKPLAGGQSLIPAMNFRLARPSALVDLGGVAELTGIGETADGGLRIGAMTTHAAVERSALVDRLAPLVAEAMPHVAHSQIRSRGTMGGSLAHADPSAELPAVMVALNAAFILRGSTGERRVAAADFFTGLFETVLETGELLVAVETPPLVPRTGTAFMEIARRHGDYALAGVAAQLSLDEVGRVAAVRVSLFSVGDRPVLATTVESLVGGPPTTEAIAAAAESVREAVDPPGDIHADAGYRRQLAGVLTRRALALCAQRATVQADPSLRSG